MSDSQYDHHQREIVPLCHVLVLSGHFHDQQGVVVGFDETMIPAGGSIMVYMRNAPSDLFMHGNKSLITEEHRKGMPAIEDADSNPLTVAFEEKDLVVINTECPKNLTGQVQPRKSHLTLAQQKRLGITRDRRGGPKKLIDDVHLKLAL